MACHPASRPVVGRRQFWAVSVRTLQTADWYVLNFGMTVAHEINLPDGSRVRLLENEAVLIEMKQRSEMPSDPASQGGAGYGYFKVGWFVANLGSELERLTRRGIVPVTQIIEQRPLGIRFFVVQDPEGNPVQIFERIQ